MTTGIDPDLIQRNLTTTDHENIDQAYGIRRDISNTALYSSLILGLLSFALLQFKVKVSAPILKPVMIVSLIIAAVLILVNGIHFIPGPPIR